MSNPTDGHALPLAGVRVLELGGSDRGTLRGEPVCPIRRRGHQDRVTPAQWRFRSGKWRKLHKGTSVWCTSFARNKKSVTLNLEVPGPEGRAIVRRPRQERRHPGRKLSSGRARSLGLGWDDLSTASIPAWIMVRISGYGQTGPSRDKPGFAAIAEAHWRSPSSDRGARSRTRYDRASAWATPSRRSTR